jgi:hypothetical protein
MSDVKNILENEQTENHYIKLSEVQSILMNNRYSTIHRTLSRSTKKKNKRPKLPTIDENKQHNDYYTPDHADQINDDANGDEYSEASQEKIKPAKFTGYLNDKSASYNLYLRAGIGSKFRNSSQVIIKS